MPGIGDGINTPDKKETVLRCDKLRNIFSLGWGWTVTINTTDNTNDILLWCVENLKKVKIEGRIRTDVMKSKWVSLQYTHGGFCYEKNVNNAFLAGRTAFPDCIRIWFKNDTDAAAFKLRWM